MVSQTFDNDRHCTGENGIQMVVILFREVSDLKSNSTYLRIWNKKYYLGKKVPLAGLIQLLIIQAGEKFEEICPLTSWVLNILFFPSTP